jgi:vacuolar-type H+-ATPase subunit C/Vma6
MAHTRLHPRDGTERISNDDVLGTLFELADLVRDIHESATKEIITVDTKYYEYDNIATITWRKLLHNLLNDEV